MSRQRLARRLSTLLLIVGLGLGLDVVLTLAWQEPVTAVIAAVGRSGINERFAHRLALGRVSAAELASIHTVDERIAFLAHQEADEVPAGAALGALAIPSIGLHAAFVQGTNESSLALGPGHYDSTALPGEGRTIAIAGHRTTYLAPFRHIDRLRAGDRIQLAMPYGVFLYVVTSTRVVAPDAWWITADTGQERLVLSACNPLFSASQRLVVFARLSTVIPTGPGRAA